MTNRARATEGSNRQPALFDMRYISNATSTSETLAQIGMNDFQSAISRLENLPAEILSNILESSVDIQSLRNLTKASPTFYARYKASEKSILQATLARELDGFTVDAVATVESGIICHRSREDSTSNIDITNFFVSYEEKLENPDNVNPLGKLSLSSIKYLLRYHLTTIVPLSNELAKQALTNFANSIPYETPKMDESLSNGIKLSPKERQRLIQALYRLETYYNLFGSRITRFQFARASFAANEVLPLFKPWGIEAMACVEVLAREFLKNTIHQAYKDQFRGSTRCWLISETERDHFVRGIIPVGLDTLARFYSATSDPILLFSLIAEHAVMYDGLDPHFLRMLRYAEGLTGDEAVLPRYVRHSDQAPFGMSEVSWSRTNVIKGDWVPETFRSWGYAIWDRSRWADVELRLGFLRTVWIDEAREKNRLRYEVQHT